MRKFLLLGLLLPLAGCLTSSSPSVVYWGIDNISDKKLVSQPKYGVVRLAQVAIRSPYDGAEMAVLRADGSIVFDSFNRFASQPSALLRGAVIDAVRSSGYFSNVVGQSSAVRTDCLLECEFCEIALNCRDEGERKAEVSVVLRLLDRNYNILKRTYARETCGAGDGNFAKAFSTAYSNAMTAALQGL